MEMKQTWEDLRRQARQIESEIDVKIVSFSKLGTTIQTSTDWSNGDLSSHSNSTTCEAMALQIEQLLNKLSSLNDDLAEAVSTMNQQGAATSSVLHTLERHNGILADYKQEFQKLKGKIHIEQERADLLGSVRRDIAAHKSTGGDRRTELLMGEHDRLLSSDRMAGEALGVAMRAREGLESQRRRLGNITGQISVLMSRFPIINNLTSKINLRKRRDSIIMGAVIAGCIIILFLFM